MHRIPTILVAIGWGLTITVSRLVAQEPPPPNQGQSTAGTVITPDDMLDNALKLFDSGDLQESASLTDRVRRMKPDHPKLLLLQGLFLVESKRSLEAVEYFRKYNDSDMGKKDYRGFAAVGGIYKRSFAYPSAERPYELAQKFAPIEVNGRPVRAEILIDYSSVLQKLKKTKQAMSALKEAEGLAPNDAGVQLSLAEVTFESQDNPAAIRYLDRSIELTTGQLRADPFKKAEYERLKEANELKIKIGQAQANENPDDGQPYYLIAEATRALGEADRRISLLQARELALRALAKDPKQHPWRIFLARIEWDLGGIQDAVDHVNEVLKEEPENAAALQFKEEMQARMRAANAP